MFTDGMITGVVTERREASIRLKVRGPTEEDQEIEAIIDTGFDGWLSLPSSIIGQLGLPWRRRGRALLADGSEMGWGVAPDSGRPGGSCSARRNVSARRL